MRLLFFKSRGYGILTETNSSLVAKHSHAKASKSPYVNPEVDSSFFFHNMTLTYVKFCALKLFTFGHSDGISEGWTDRRAI